MTRVSGLRTSANGRLPARMPWLVAAAKPRLRSFTVSSTSGNSRTTISAVPSPEALSITRTVVGTDAGC